MTIDYLGHSGFLVETQSALLLFDYDRGDLSLLDRKPLDKPLYVFVSHAHEDHFNPKIFSLAGGGRRVRYILSFDLRGNAAVPRTADALYTEADADYEVPGLGSVRTLRSTDEGVAFLVTAPDATVYHAGDLNWWDWKGEDPDWLAEQRTVFQRETAKLARVRIDVAFAVLDDRLEENYAKGLNWFLSVCRPAYVLPMHFWTDRSVVARFKALPGEWSGETRILDTTAENHWEL
jgi:L-ascorbate metabolism protein UlaG (beta-lactamase superfamily)